MFGRLMFSFVIYMQGLAVLAAAALCTWVFSLWRRNVAIIDSLWSLMFVLAAFTYAHAASRTGPRAILALVLVSVWALRLSLYITWRNWGHGEDRRYQAIRARNEPHFPIKSLYLVFGLQALLAWVILAVPTVLILTGMLTMVLRRIPAIAAVEAGD